MITIISSIITGAVVALITWLITSKSIERNNNIKIGNANDKAKEIIEIAEKEAESLKKEAAITAKEETLQLKNQLEGEIKEQRNEVQQYEKRIIAKEESLDRKISTLDKREMLISEKETSVDELRSDITKIKTQQTAELERIAGFTADQAKEYLLKKVEEEIRDESAKIIKNVEAEAREEADKKARDIIVSAIAKCDVDHISEATVSTVELPSDEMKGRIIGREGRNIRTFEAITGVELIVDDTPEAVVLSCFNPIRRQIAKLALEKLMADGRIHPARIEEMVEKSKKELDEKIKSIGEATIMDVGMHGLHPEIVKLLGRMNYRSSFGQNALKHSIEVAILSGLLAAEVGEDQQLAKRTGLLHNIGKAVDFEMEGSHVQIGSEICRKYKENPVVINAVESHHGDVEPDNIISVLVQCADMISAARPGARRVDLEVYINSLILLEEISNSHKGVEKSFAIQAGREVRIMVIPELVSDSEMVLLAKDISKQIEDELQYPGQIKVSVIRESRAVDYAK